MAAEAKPKGKARNFYQEAMNDPEVLERRKQRQAELDGAVKRMLEDAPGRVPHWDRERLMQIDRLCLENGKRCIMWDDEDAGFFLMLNWDWLANRPAELPSEDARVEPGWWANVKHMLGLPLLDTSLPEADVAAWVDKHTMRVHNGFLHKLDRLRRDSGTGKVLLDDPYWQKLQALPRWVDEEADAAAEPGRAAGAAGGAPAAAQQAQPAHT